ncbi:hypothetical protein F5Y01DRAFT_293195 [Xylaria sp. FL0043]|nr:hypothetical protein F5Y01DRAFT_293195 [Xylaria sp. FL0043]
MIQENSFGLGRGKRRGISTHNNYLPISIGQNSHAIFAFDVEIEGSGAIDAALTLLLGGASGLALGAVLSSVYDIVLEVSYDAGPTVFGIVAGCHVWLRVELFGAFIADVVCCTRPTHIRFLFLADYFTLCSSVYLLFYLHLRSRLLWKEKERKVRISSEGKDRTA